MPVRAVTHAASYHQVTDCYLGARRARRSLSASRAAYEFAAAVRARVLERPGAIGAERALKGADVGLSVRCQRGAAPLTRRISSVIRSPPARTRRPPPPTTHAADRPAPTRARGSRPAAPAPAQSRSRPASPI